MIKVFGKRIYFLFVLIVICVICTGCFQGQFNVNIDENGAIVVQTEMSSVPLLASQVEQLKDQFTSGHPEAEVVSINNGGWNGYNIKIKYANIRELAKNGYTLLEPKKDLCKGIQFHEGWFYDTYSFDLFQTHHNNGDMPPESRAMLAQVRYDFVLNLPYPVDSHNADSAVNDSKTLTWHLAQALIENVDLSMQAKFKIWHKGKIALTFCAILIILGASIFYFRQSKSEDENVDNEGALTKARICMGLTVALIALSAYAALVPTELTDKDILSANTIQLNNAPVQQVK